MKSVNSHALLHYLCVAMLALTVAGCATAPSSNSREQTALSAAETAIYQDALANMKAGEMDKAGSGFKKVTQSHPAFIGGWINLASANYNSKKFEEARSALNTAKNINPNIAEIYNLSGLLDVEKGEYQSAEKNYLAAIALKQDYATAHYNLAIVYDVFYQQLDKAISHYEQYLTLSGNNDKSTISWVAELKAKLKRKAS